VTVPAPDTCLTVLLYGQKRDMNAYLATRPSAPVGSLSDIIAANNVIPGALKYGQAIFEAADMLDLSPGSADTLRYLADRAETSRDRAARSTECTRDLTGSPARPTISTRFCFRATTRPGPRQRQGIRA
jgi:hypothetical protein